MKRWPWLALPAALALWALLSLTGAQARIACAAIAPLAISDQTNDRNICLFCLFFKITQLFANKARPLGNRQFSDELRNIICAQFAILALSLIHI